MRPLQIYRKLAKLQIYHKPARSTGSLALAIIDL
jgi:hypothetical protein